jgi:hypothetical protein
LDEAVPELLNLLKANGDKVVHTRVKEPVKTGAHDQRVIPRSRASSRSRWIADPINAA